MPRMMQNTVIFNKKIIISCIAMIASMLLFAFSACTGGRGTGQDSTAAPALLTPSVEPTEEMTIKPSAAATNDPEEDIVAEMMTEMTLEEKVGQLFIVRPESLDESFTPNQAHGSAQYSDTDCSAGMAAMMRSSPGRRLSAREQHTQPSSSASTTVSPFMSAASSATLPNSFWIWSAGMLVQWKDCSKIVRLRICQAAPPCRI